MEYSAKKHADYVASDEAPMQERQALIKPAREATHLPVSKLASVGSQDVATEAMVTPAAAARSSSAMG